jgi:TM2 domain-containing membrane protein YozV
MPIPPPSSTPPPSPPPGTPATHAPAPHAHAEPRPYTGPAQREEFQPVAAILALIVPGAGHFYLGQARRAGLVALGILGLFFSGLLIGGIDVVDRRENPIWFFGQALVGPLTFGVNHIHQNHFKVLDPATGRLRTARPELRDPAGTIVSPPEIRGPGGIARLGNPGDRPPNSQSLGRMNELGTLFVTIAGMLNLIAILDAAFAVRRGQSDRAIENARRFMQGGRSAP